MGSVYGMLRQMANRVRPRRMRRATVIVVVRTVYIARALSLKSPGVRISRADAATFGQLSLF